MTTGQVGAGTISVDTHALRLARARADAAADAVAALGRNVRAVPEHAYGPQQAGVAMAGLQDRAWQASTMMARALAAAADGLATAAQLYEAADSGVTATLPAREVVRGRLG